MSRLDGVIVVGVLAATGGLVAVRALISWREFRIQQRARVLLERHLEEIERLPAGENR